MNFSISEIREIVETIQVYDNMDYGGYGISFLKRRFAKVFDTHNIRKTVQFYELLKDESMRDRIAGEMFVDSTEMFRDPAFWRFVRDNVLHQLTGAGDTIWLPNEAGGEEAWSFSILIHEQNIADRLSIVCSNPSTSRCNVIGSGAVDANQFELNYSNYKRLEDKDDFETYFVKDAHTHTVTEWLRSSVCCRALDYASAIADEKICMIASRNQALYFGHDLMEHYYNTLYDRLSAGGYLAIGVKEQLPASVAEKMTVVSETEKVYRK
ncbi:MAG: hypothetical protein LBV41_11895 [Cytophagaceae bacterium]|jgi:chemotaxis protein methyltransferase CheR|nr:hypothetical protein [Cytophagaceae bacterium]